MGGKATPDFLAKNAFANVVERAGSPDAPTWSVEFLDDLAIGYVKDGAEKGYREVAFVSAGGDKMLVLISRSSNH